MFAKKKRCYSSAPNQMGERDFFVSKLWTMGAMIITSVQDFCLPSVNVGGLIAFVPLKYSSGLNCVSLIKVPFINVKMPRPSLQECSHFIWLNFINSVSTTTLSGLFGFYPCTSMCVSTVYSVLAWVLWKQKSKAYYLGGIRTQDLCNSRTVSYQLKILKPFSDF